MPGSEKTSQCPMFREVMGIRISTTITLLVQHNFLVDSKSYPSPLQKLFLTSNGDYHRGPQLDTSQRSTHGGEPRPIDISVSRFVNITEEYAERL